MYDRIHPEFLTRKPGCYTTCMLQILGRYAHSYDTSNTQQKSGWKPRLLQETGRYLALVMHEQNLIPQKLRRESDWMRPASNPSSETNLKAYRI